MILQSINLLDESEKEINNYVMRLMEWAVWSFPECAKVVPEHKQYCKIMSIIGGDKKAMANPEVQDKILKIIPQDKLAQLVQQAAISVGTEIIEEDKNKI